MADPAPTPLLRRLIARCWYLWGLSLCYAGGRALDRSFFEAGVRSFGRAARLWPAFVEAYYQRGAVRGRELSQYHEAVADLGKAIELNPEWAEPYLQRGLLHRFNGTSEDARADLARYLDLAPAGYWRDEAKRQLQALDGEQERPHPGPVV